MRKSYRSPTRKKNSLRDCRPLTFVPSGNGNDGGLLRYSLLSQIGPLLGRSTVFARCPAAAVVNADVAVVGFGWPSSVGKRHFHTHLGARRIDFGGPGRQY